MILITGASGFVGTNLLKYLYANSIIKNIKSDVYKNFYMEHLRLWNNFREYDNPNKNTFAAFDEDFHKIIKSFKASGFNPEISKIPILEDKYIVNGAHRVAAALATNKEVYVIDANMPHDGQKDCSWKNHLEFLSNNIMFVFLRGNTQISTPTFFANI
jgi:hypothetical protein